MRIGITKTTSAPHGGVERTPKVSVILPVHNVEPYIGCCIDSLKAQTMQDLEFIFVDDCSTDASMAAVKAWAAEDDRVRILRNEVNLGSGPARNCGIEVARGEYLSFADPDDYMARDFYELLYAAATAGGGHDIAKGRYCKVDEKTGLVGQPERWQNKAIRRYLCMRKPLFLCFTYEHCTALWKRELFRNPKVRFGTSITAQDTTFQLTACFQTNDIVLEDRALYYYVQHPSSATHRSLKARTYGEVASLDEKVSFLLSEGMDGYGAAYFCKRVEAYLDHFQTALGEGLVSQNEVPIVAVRLFQTLLRVLDATPQAYEWPQIRGVIMRLLRILPGERSSGEGDVRVSVILPVYNPGEGIRECIKSLRSQLLDGLEFIFVDDCSTDESMAAVRAWAAEDSRVRILKNEQNLGAGPSRNRGIEAARGDYLSFIDSDDYVSCDFYELLYAAATADGGHDIAKGELIEIDAQGEKDQEHGWIINDSIASRLSKRPLYLRFTDDHWTAIYKQSLFEDGGVRYGTSRKSEDSTFTLRVCHETQDVVIEPEAGYYHFTHWEGFAVDKRDAQQLKYELDGLKQKIEFFEENGFDASACRYFSYRIHRFLSNCYTSLHANPSIANELRELSSDLGCAVESVPGLRLLQSDCFYRAFVECNEPLPEIGFLPSSLKIDGVSQWIAFIFDYPEAGPDYLNGCARAMALCIQQLAGEKGFLKMYLQIAGQMQTLPSQRRCAIWLMLNQHLASARSFRNALGKTKRKVLLFGSKVKKLQSSFPRRSIPT